MDSKREITRATTTTSTKSFLSRTFTRHGSEATDEVNDSKGPLGLNTLYDPGPDRAAIADIIFVHGLNGGSQSTWSKGNNPSNYWPQEWLPLDDAFCDVRIHSFGYSSGISRESVLNVRDFASSLLAAIKDSPVTGRGQQSHLVFVAHSMGGLVVKKAVILGHQEPEYKSVIDRLCSIVFLATPHQGAAIAQTLSRLVALVGARPFVDDLLPQSPMLQAINEDFPRVAANIQLMSFYETRPMSLGGIKALVVEKNSAVMNLPNERRTLLDANHRNVAMFSSPNDPVYVTVRNALATIVSSQRDSKQSHQQIVRLEDQVTLNEFLGLYDAPEDDIMTHDSVRLPGSCEWLSNKDYYRSWKEACDSSLLWLRGRPGAGKSVLSGHVINDMRTKGRDCCFFFFQSSDNVKSSANTFLRSMAWQMAMLHPEILSKIKELMTEWKDKRADTIDPSPIWRKLYLTGILKVRLNRPQFWVIDAMDECKSSLEVMNFLGRMQEQWPLSVLITSRDPVEAHLSKANPRLDITSHIITDEDSREDIRLLLKSNLDFLPCPASEKWPTPEAMVSQIIKNSGGCFLWASLICSELREVTSEKEIEEVLDSIPADMDALYTKILQDMGNARFGKDLAKAFITWTTYAFRPMTATEIQEPIEMDINDKIDDVERAISKCCGNIIYVNTHNKVQLVHSTAREFLTKGRMASEFIVSKAEGHRRLAKVCLQFLINSDRNAGKPMRLGSDPEITTVHGSLNGLFRPRRLGSEPEVRHHHRPSLSQPVAFDEHPFTSYASKYVFQHLNLVSSTDDETLNLVSKFLGGSSVLRWIEFIATHGNLHTVYQAGKTINAMLNRRSQHSPPLGLARGQKKFQMLDKWGDDLIHLVTKFSSRLRTTPQAIHHLIPPFCPSDSAIRQQFCNPYRGLNVLGLSKTGWDDCLTTISYAKGMKPNTVASGPGHFAVGMMNARGDLIIYDDSIFQVVHTLAHMEPVWRLAFSEHGTFLASAGAKTLRIWSLIDGQELVSFKIPSLCLALQFSEEDTVLRVATRQNELLEFDMLGQTFLREEPASWTADLEETMQFRAPTLIALGSATGLLSVIYRGENIVLWDYLEDIIHDVYEKETGSVFVYGSHKLAEGTTTVTSVTFSQAVDTNLLAAAYTDGDLIVYDLTSGEAIASALGVNINLVSSSPDGRTLAGVDSRGNLTLFEFESLRALYRIRLDTPILPKGLIFTSDSLRFIEIRGQQCRVWEPTVLLRTDSKEDENSDTVSVTTGTQDREYHAVKEVTITAVTCCRTSSIVYYATTEGSVYICDINGEPQSYDLFVQTAGCAIDILYIDETSSILACGDRSGRVTARKVTRRNGPRQHSFWETSDPIVAIDTAVQRRDVLKGVIISDEHSRILVSTENYNTLRSMPSHDGSSWIAQLDGDGQNRWMPHPSKVQCLVRASRDLFVVYNWSDLQMISSITVPTDNSFDRLAPLHHPPFFATISTAATGSLEPAKYNSHDLAGFSRIQIWDSKDLDASEPVKPIHQLDRALASEIEHIIGAFGFRMIVYTTDHWIASVDLYAPENGSAGHSVVRHFFMPSDWASVDHKKLIFGIGRLGEIIFAKHSELAVIRRGLEVTESGSGFNPRRGSARSLSIRSRGPSPGPPSSGWTSPRPIQRPWG